MNSTIGSTRIHIPPSGTGRGAQRKIGFSVRAPAGLFGGERVFREKSGSRKEIQQHVTLGHGRKPDASLQIYFDITPKGVVEVGHVGAHLRTVSENT